MLKSRGRTKEVFVMKMEEWPQVIIQKYDIIQSHKDYE